MDGITLIPTFPLHALFVYGKDQNKEIINDEVISEVISEVSLNNIKHTFHRLDFLNNGIDIFKSVDKSFIPIPNDKEEYCYQYYQRYKTLNHDNLITVYGIYERDKKKYLVTEYFTKLSFTNYFRNDDNANLKQEFIRCLQDLCGLVKYLTVFFEYPIFLCHKNLSYDNTRVKFVPNFAIPDSNYVLAPEEIFQKFLMDYKDLYEKIQVKDELCRNIIILEYFYTADKMTDSKNKDILLINKDILLKKMTIGEIKKIKSKDLEEIIEEKIKKMKIKEKKIEIEKRYIRRYNEGVKESNKKKKKLKRDV